MPQFSDKNSWKIKVEKVKRVEQIFDKCKEVALKTYETFDASHDYSHIKRVMKNAEEIVKTEPYADKFVIRLAVLLHDIDDAKYHSEANPSASEILYSKGADQELANKVLACIESVSFSGGNAKDLTSVEGSIVRDADRLDAIGAIGIARTFGFGGARARKLYDTDEIVRENMSESEYRERGTASITHFHEKLLLLKDLMVTKEGKRLAEERHIFMLAFLKQLDKEIG